MHIKTRLTLYNDNQPDSLGFGRGMMLLLQEIEKTGSIKKAAASMEMAYSKAWKLLTTTEKEFKIILLARKGHQGSSLTPEAKQLLHAYLRIRQDMHQAAQASFEKHL